METAYVYTCRAWDGDDTVMVFRNHDDAKRALKDDIETEMQNLREEGREEIIPLYGFGGDSGSIYVERTDIYFDFNIEAADLQ